MTLSAIALWLRSVPQWLWIGLLILLGIATVRRKAHQVYEQGKADERRDIIDDIETATDTAEDRANDAENRITADLNAGQLDRLSERARAHPFISEPDL